VQYETTVPSWTDKLVGEVIRLLLEAYYEPRFSARSHGFRPRRGCHTALTEVAETWTGTTWFIEGDISDCFGSLDHDVMITILAEKIHDNRFLRLLRNMLQAGYLEDWTWNATLSGAPQGGVTSPILSNIYLHKLDLFVEQTLIPEYTRGARRTHNPAYHRLSDVIERGRRRGDRAMVRQARKQRRLLPSLNPRDPGYRRLRYSRYADDHLLGFTGPKAEAEQIKQRLAAFLHDELKLELCQDKTLITHARSQAARYLGYEITAHHDHRKGSRGRRWTDGFIKLSVPPQVIKAKIAPYLRRGKPAHRPDLINQSDHTIVATFGAQYRGLVQYYLLAGNVYRLSRLEWAMRTSMLRTLAAKHRSSVSKMTARHRVKTQTPYGLRTCFEARIQRQGRTPLVARFGGIPLRRNRNAVPYDRLPDPTPHRHREVVQRLLHGACEICQQTDNIQVHQIRRLADLTGKAAGQGKWATVMARKRRKTLVLCGACHDAVHAPATTA
jgi:group II intron reverse transcriptase/maturase